MVVGDGEVEIGDCDVKMEVDDNMDLSVGDVEVEMGM